MLYQMNVCNKLLTHLKLSGIDASTAVVFFGTQARCMMDCKPNYGPHRSIPGMPTFRFKTWVLKGYYPETTTLFRISMIQDPERVVSDGEYFVKVTIPPIVLNKKKIPISARFSSDTIDQFVTGNAEHAIFGSTAPPIIDVDKLNIPKCVSPRGMPVFKVKRSTK
jgi:hypothetical protein